MNNTLDTAETVLTTLGLDWTDTHGAGWTAMIVPLSPTEGVRVFSDDTETHIAFSRCDATGYPRGERVDLSTGDRDMLAAMLTAYIAAARTRAAA